MTSIRAMAQKNEILILSEKWPDKEERIIRAQYPQMGPSVASLFHGRRSEEACRKRALSLSIASSLEKVKWSVRELEILQENYPQTGKKAADLLLGGAGKSCKDMAARLGLVKDQKVFTSRAEWSEDEIKILTESYPKLGSAVHEFLLNRTDTSCVAMAHKLGISFEQAKDIVKWTPEEIGILKSNYY